MMGNICCKFFPLYAENSSNSLPHLVLYKSNDIPTITTPPLPPQKSTGPETIEIISPPVELPKQKSSHKLEQHPKPTIIGSYLVVCLISETDEDHNSLNHLRRIVKSFRLFNNIDEFFAFIVQIKEEKLFLIVSDIFAQNILSFIHKISPLTAIYILSNDPSKDQQWIKQYPKIKGIFTEIKPICQELQHFIHLSEHDSLPIEIVNSSSMIIQNLMKQVLFEEINYDENSKRDWIDFARKEYPDELEVIKEFEETYTPSTAIWWYTRKCFLYSAMNEAFRTQNFSLMIKMGFFIRDLHRKIDRTPSEMTNSKAIIVYRGQGISENELEAIKTHPNGIVSFNNILWTNSDRTIALNLAQSAKTNPDFFGVLFRIEINSIITLISLKKRSYYFNSEHENLLSIYSLFRIADIQQIEDQIWEINLLLIPNNNHASKDLPEQTAWQQLASYFLQINQFDQAEELYKILLQSTSIHDPQQIALLNEELAILYQKKNDPNNSLLYYKKSLKDYLTFSSQTDSNLFNIYLNMGLLLHQQNNLNDAIKHLKYALNIALHSLPLDHSQVSNLYHHLAEIYDEQGIFIDAIQNYQSALENELNHFPLDHLSIAKTYNKIGEVFYRMEDYTTAFSYFDKTLKIQKRSLSPNHSILAITNYNIAMALDGLQHYKEAIEYASQAVNIARHSFGSNHKDVQLYEEYLDELRQKTLIGVIPNGAVYG